MSASDQPTSDSSLLDHFALFGIERKLAIDSEKLEARFHTLQMASHPDRFGTGEAADLELAEDTSASINTAYRVLREPIARLRYLLSLYGYSVEQSKAVPKSLLMAIMESQEAISELESATSGADTSKALAALKTSMEAWDLHRKSLTEKRDALSQKWDALSGVPHDKTGLTDEQKEMLDRFVNVLVERAYLETLSTAVRDALDGVKRMIRH
jgi:molecular chaperone HscB